MAKSSNEIMMTWDVFEAWCKEFGIDASVCQSLTIELVLGEPVRVYPKMVVRKDAEIFEMVRHIQPIAGGEHTQEIYICSVCSSPLDFKNGWMVDSKTGKRFCSHRCVSVGG